MVYPQKRLGQVFLKDKKILKKIVEAGQIKREDLVLEIGPGTGVLTEALLLAGARVIAVEKDRNLAKYLEERFQHNCHLTIIQADILDFFKNPKFKNLKLKIKNHKIIGNIPYYLTSRLIRLILEQKIKPKLIILMIQKEVAQRIASQPPKMNLLAAATQFYAKPEIISYVPQTAFWPKPKVNSTIIKLTPKNTALNTNKKQIELFFKTIKAGFSQPRKLLINNLHSGLKIEKSALEKIFLLKNLPLNSRAQNLDLQSWIKLSQQLNSCLK